MVFIRIPLQFLTFQWKWSVNKPTLDFWQMLQRPVISRMHAYFGWFLKWTRKNCFRYLKLMSPLNENTFLKNNYLTLRSKVKVSRKSLWYATHRLMIMHPHTKCNWPIWKDKKSYGPDKLRWEAEEAEAEDKIRLKQYVSLRSKGRHNKRKILFWKFSKLKVIHSPSK